MFAEFSIKATVEQLAELKKHLWTNGYGEIWNGDSIFSVIEDNVAYIETILSDRNIRYTYTFKDEDKE